jgi:membrane protease YdiL (CAAX protease family)
MMKLLLWVIPAILIIRATERTVGDVFALQRVRQIILWGVGIGLLLLITVIATKAFSGKPIVSSSLGWPMVNAVVVAPIVEEITFRGAILGSLRRQYRFALANTVTAVLFVGAHLPGWYFQGRLLINLVTPIGGALSIFLLGLIFGWVAHRSESVTASMLAHALNNLGSSL